MGNPYNKVKIIFSTPQKGIMTKQGISGEWTGEDMPELTDINATCFYEEHSGAIMLKPKMEYKDMTLTDIETHYPAGDVEDMFEARTVIGKPYRKTIIHQFDASKLKWGIKTNEVQKEQQGFMIWYAKRPKMEEEVPITILLTDTNVSSPDENAPVISTLKGKMIMLEIKTDQIMLKQSFKTRRNPNGFPADYEQKIEEWKITPPQHFFQKEGELEWATLIIFFVENNIIIGFNGLEKTERKIAKYYDVEEDKIDKEYAVVMPNRSRLWIWGGGVAYLGWQPLKYEPEGQLQTITFESPEALGTVKTEILKKTIPSGTSLTISGKKKNVTSGSQPFYVLVTLKGTGEISPFLYRFRIKGDVLRSSGTGPTVEIEGDVLECSETVHGNMDGSFGSGGLTIRITCASTWYSNIFQRKNSHIRCEFTLYNKDEVKVVEGYYVDITSAERPEFGNFELLVEASPITKRLQILPILESESYDHREFKHGDLVSELCDKAGVQLTADSDASDPLLPISEDARTPNWQYQRGTKYLEALNNVRQFSGWCMFPKGRRRLYYLKRPSLSDSPVHTFDMESDAFTSIRYERADGFRTRFLIIGIDKDGKGLMAYDLDRSLEQEIGESRPVVIIDPKLASLDACETMKNGLMEYYTEEQFYARFRIERFENYFDLKIFDVISIADIKTPEVNGKYMILAKNVVISPFTCVADIEAKSLWS